MAARYDVMKKRVKHTPISDRAAGSSADFVEAHRDDFLRDLDLFLRIPSISTDPSTRSDCRRAAEFMAGQLHSAGLEHVDLIEGRGNPLVYADWLHAAGKPTLLFYGHYDVQPPDPLDEWRTPPFEPARIGDNLYARGAADDKGFTLAMAKAMQSVIQTNGKLPVNVRFLIEGDEETGSEAVEDYVREHAAELRANAVVICNSEMFASELPTICVGARGLVYGEIYIEGAAHDLHSGMYGGIAPNALQAIVDLISSIKDRSGRIQIPGFYDRVQRPSQHEVESWARLPFREEDYLAKEVGATQAIGEPGYSVFERLWARPTFELHGIPGGFTGEGAKTSIPARASAKVSVRLVPDQTTDEAVRQITKPSTASAPRESRPSSGCCTRHRRGPSTLRILSSPRQPQRFVSTFRKDPAYVRSGSSMQMVSSHSHRA